MDQEVLYLLVTKPKMESVCKTIIKEQGYVRTTAA